MVRAFRRGRERCPERSLRNQTVLRIHRAHLPFFFLLASLALATRTARADVSELYGEDVASVHVEGNRRIEAAAVLPLLETAAGEPLTVDALQRDLRTLWSQKFFADLAVDVKASADGPVVTFLVKEKPLVREVRINGNTEIDDEDLKKELDLKPFQILDDDAMRRTVRKLEAKYVDKGFFLAEVRSEVLPAPGDNQVDVVFDIIEHAKVEVRRVAFRGNSAIDDDELKSVMATRESSLLSFLTSQGTFKEEAFQRDLLVLQSLYYNKGYINVRIGRPAVSLSPDKRFIFVTIPIEEGEPYDFGEVRVSGDLLGEKEALEKLIKIRQGERFSSQTLQQAMQSLQDFFRDRGRAYVQITPKTGIDVQDKQVALDFVVAPGPLVTIERIDIVGNTKTRDKVIRREMRISEGDIYDGSGIRLSKARVTALGFFETVDITSHQGTRPDTMVLEVSVREKATGTFQVGLGFSNNEPILFNANISQNNFLGWGTNAAFMAQLSRLRRIFSLSYTDPYCLDSNWTCAFDVFNTLQIFEAFDRQAYGGTLTGGFQVSDDVRLFLTYTGQQVNVVPGGANTVLLANRFRGGFTSSLKFSFNWDRRDNRLYPTRGTLVSGSVEVADPTFTFSQNEFNRWTGVFRFYQPLPLGIVFKVNMTAGIINSPLENPVPVSELFYEGGINSLRGYDFRTVAPQIEAGAAPGLPLSTITIGGNKEFLSNWELEFPILESAGLRGVVFFDAGNVYAESESFFDQDASGKFGLLMSVGVGARWFTPLGPLRFEWGVPLTRRIGDSSNRFEFTIGNFF